MFDYKLKSDARNRKSKNTQEIPEEFEGGDFQTQQSYEDQSREHRSYEKSTLRKFQGVLLQTGGKVTLRNEIFTTNKLNITYLGTKSFH